MKSPESKRSIKSMADEALSILVAFRFFGDAEDITEVQKIITEEKLKTLEEYTHESRETLEKFKPGLCDRYNTLVQGLEEVKVMTDKKLAYEKFQGIVIEAKKL